MTIEYENGIVKNANFVGGCGGNLRGIFRLIEGMKLIDVITKLEGIKCHGSRDGKTSCPDQIALALKNIKL